MTCSQQFSFWRNLSKDEVLEMVTYRQISKSVTWAEVTPEILRPPLLWHIPNLVSGWIVDVYMGETVAINDLIVREWGPYSVSEGQNFGRETFVRIIAPSWESVSFQGLPLTDHRVFNPDRLQSQNMFFSSAFNVFWYWRHWYFI